MSDTFSLYRFFHLLKKTILERPAQLAGTVALALAITLLTYAIVRTMSGFEDAQTFSFIFGLVGGGCFLGTLVLSYFHSNAAGSSFLTLPSSAFEKWLTAVLITGVFFPVIFLALFRGIDYAFVQQFHRSLDPKDPFYHDKYDSVKIFIFDGFVAQKTYLMFANLVGAIMVGALYFNKASFIKTGLIIAGLYIGGFFLNTAIAGVYFGNFEKALPYYAVFIRVGKEYGKVLLSATASRNVDIISFFIVPAILWLTTLVRLREKEF